MGVEQRLPDGLESSFRRDMSQARPLVVPNRPISGLSRL
jgi:hypothetical protein